MIGSNDLLTFVTVYYLISRGSFDATEELNFIVQKSHIFKLHIFIIILQLPQHVRVKMWVIVNS